MTPPAPAASSAPASSGSSGSFTRADGRATDELRPVTIQRRWLDHAEGSALITFGRTRVLVAARLFGVRLIDNLPLFAAAEAAPAC